MFYGQGLMAENFDDGSGGGVAANTSKVHTHWFPGQGDMASFIMEIMAQSIQTSGGTPASKPRLKMIVETKNSDDLDSAATSPGSATFEANSGTSFPATASVSGSGLKELVRLTFELEETETTSIAERTFFSVFRALNPSWQTH